MFEIKETKYRVFERGMDSAWGNIRIGIAGKSVLGLLAVFAAKKSPSSAEEALEEIKEEESINGNI